MSLNSPLFYVIPEEAIQVAKAAFPEGNRYILLRDALGSLFHNPNFQHLSPIPVRRAKIPLGSP